MRPARCHSYKVVVKDQTLVAIYTNTEVKVLRSDVYKTASVSTSAFVDAFNGSSTSGWTDLDVESPTRVWVAGTTGLTLATWNSTGAGFWQQVLYNHITSLFCVAVSPLGDVVYVTTLTSVYSFNPAAGTYNNNGEAPATDGRPCLHACTT
jgi:hypothetical protein